MGELTYKIYTLGCKVNQYDSSNLSDKLNSSGFKAVNKLSDIAIINTCAVTMTAIRKAKRMLNKAKRENPHAKTVIMGCWPKIYKKDVNKLDADFVFGVGESELMLKKIISIFDAGNKEQTRRPENKVVNNNKSRYFIKIQDGCEQYCSYCIIPYARGKLKSRPENEVLNEIKTAVSSGHREVVLSGIHLGLYGVEKGGREKLTILLKNILKIGKLKRIRLSSIEVTEVNDGIIKLISRKRNSKKSYICRHLHIPLQSGSDTILKLMNRPCSVKYYKDRIKTIRELIPDIAISTDIIVGFPGEAEKEFFETIEFVKKLKFSRIHVFPFSAHEKTPATGLPGRIGDSIKTKRAIELRKLGKRLENDYRAKFTDQEFDLVVEKVQNNKYIGKSEFYFDVKFDESQIVDKNINPELKPDLIREVIKVVV